MTVNEKSESPFINTIERAKLHEKDSPHTCNHRFFGGSRRSPWPAWRVSRSCSPSGSGHAPPSPLRRRVPCRDSHRRGCHRRRRRPCARSGPGRVRGSPASSASGPGRVCGSPASSASARADDCLPDPGGHLHRSARSPDDCRGPSSENRGFADDYEGHGGPSSGNPNQLVRRNLHRYPKLTG